MYRWHIQSHLPMGYENKQRSRECGISRIRVVLLGHAGLRHVLNRRSAQTILR